MAVEGRRDHRVGRGRAAQRYEKAGCVLSAPQKERCTPCLWVENTSVVGMRAEENDDRPDSNANTSASSRHPTQVIEAPTKLRDEVGRLSDPKGG